MELKSKNGLVAPYGFWDLSDDAKKELCNGCGPQGGIFLTILSWGIPDHLFGLDISETCNIHDYCRIIDMPQKECDNLFLDNMGALIDAAGGILRSARHWAAFHYWLAVRAWKKNERHA
jgi:hypothetical protein